MKTKSIIPALLVIALASSPILMHAQPMVNTNTQRKAQEKVKLDPELLPEAVKKSIASDEMIADLTITEAWQITDEKGSTHFKIKFDDAGVELVKKYDLNGKEIKDQAN